MEGSIIIFLSTQIYTAALEVFNIYIDVRVSTIIILYYTPDSVIAPNHTTSKKKKINFNILLFSSSTSLMPYLTSHRDLQFQNSSVFYHLGALDSVSSLTAK